MNTSLLRRLTLATALMAGALSAHAQPYSGIVIFGDSLSDTGNVRIATSGAFPNLAEGPYFNGRFSNGPIWTDFFTARFGLTATPSLLGGSNYAFGGARTSGANPPGVLQQEFGLWAKPAADPNALYVVVAGGNNMRDARSAFPTLDGAGAAGRQAAAELAIAELRTAIGGLVSLGARHVLISNLPDLGRTPEASFLGLAAVSSDATNRFNALVPGLESFFDALGVDVDVMDMAGAANNAYVDATTNGGATYGLINALAPCNGFLGSPNIAATACNLSLFSDGLHPSSAGHKLIADAAFAAVIPEPETYALMLMGLAALALQARRQRRG